MNPERWQRVHELVQDALEQPAELQSAFVAKACGEDHELRAEVLSLLGAIERSPEEPEPPLAWLGPLAGPERSRFVPGEKVAERYRIERLLGRGGMGEVYEAWDEELSIPVALKALRLASQTPEAHKHLKLEGLLARSIWHPNVCRLYDLGQHGDGADATWFLTMELLRGQTLSELLEKDGRLPLAHAQRIAEQLTAGLGAAHHAGVVHRDFKPSNVLLVTRNGGEQAVITDFGIAQAATRRALENGPLEIAVGTPAYMAPEQVRGEPVGPAADLYALGVVLYEMITGELPFVGNSALEVAERRLVERPPSPRQLRPDLDDRWEAVILRCLARHPHQRFDRAEEMADALAGRTAVAATVAIETRPRVPHTLPAERDPFIGREAESAELARHLGNARLVTLVGPGGMGKTRLAIHVGWQVLPSWPGGVWFCDVTDARGLNEIASAVAGGLGVQLGRGDPVEQLGHVIAGRGRCLVILDNFEQVVEHAPATIGRWLARAGEARFLATSRERLGLGEQVQAIGPLSAEKGVGLFLARAERLHPGLELAGTEYEAVREIVRLVDGMPLAIELAGARMRIMTAPQILAQMRKRFRLLTGGASERHETLVMAIDGSWELLKPWERSTLAQCTVFEGGFTLEAAEHVIELGAWPEAPWVVDVIQSLVDKSLLRTWIPAFGGGEGMRFGMFVSLYEYVRLKLEQDPSLASASDSTSLARATEERHGQWFARYGGPETIQALKADRRPEQRRQVDRELDNLVVACRRAIGRGDSGIAVATYRTVWAVLDVRGPVALAVDLGRAIVRALHLDRPHAAVVVKTLGLAEWLSGKVEEAGLHLEAALATAREIGDRHLEALTLGDLGTMHASQGQMREGAEYLELALAGARAVGDKDLEGNTLNTLSITRRGQGRMEEASAYAEQALQVARSNGNRGTEGLILSNLGLFHDDRGHTEEARAHFEAALAIHREVGYRRFEGNTHDNLGSLSLDQGRLEEARTHLETALAIHRETGTRFSEGIVLANLGLLFHALELPDQARTHFEAALVIARELNNRNLEGHIMRGLGRLHQDSGELESARAHYDLALAIHRATSDRRSEGVTLVHLASLFQREGDVSAAQEALAAGEPLLRAADARLDVGKLLCIRADVEHSTGESAAARVTLCEAEEVAQRLGSGPESELGRMLGKLRRTLSEP